MTFAHDRDLLVFEPALFRDAAFAAQTRVQTADASVAETTLTSLSADFVSANVDTGAVALVAGAPVEVLSRISATQLEVSQLRVNKTDAAIPPATAADATLSITTFTPQLRLIHDMLLRSVGIDPNNTAASPTAGAITNPEAFSRAEALGALHLVFSASAPLAGDDSPLWIKAELYRNRFIVERRRLVAGVDLDGDGLPDAVRRPSVIQLTRA